MRHRPFLYLLLPIISLFFSSSISAASVEFPVWTRYWTGTLGNKNIEVTLTRTADTLAGSYCYLPCKPSTRYQLSLSGAIEGNTAELSERLRNDGSNLTGVWHIDALANEILGTWTSPDGRRSFPVKLERVMSDLDKRFPYEIRLLASALPEPDISGCPTPPYVSAIRLYKNGELFQTLETDSQGTCSIYTPDLIDANFDGWPDLIINLFLPAGPNIPSQIWLYDQKTDRFIDAPQALQEITSAQFDPKYRTIYSHWRSSCCEHGVSVYQWKGSDIQQTQTASSYLLPIMDGTTPRLCYVIPNYKNGFIEFEQRVEEFGRGNLKLKNTNPADCEVLEDISFAIQPRVFIDIFRQETPSKKLKVIRRENTTWKLSKLDSGYYYCPELPFFNNGVIQRVIFTDDAALCSKQDPNRASNTE